MLCYVMLCYVMLCYVMLCYITLCYVMLCYVMLCYVMLCYTVHFILYYLILYSVLLFCTHRIISILLIVFPRRYSCIQSFKYNLITYLHRRSTAIEFKRTRNQCRTKFNKNNNKSSKKQFK